MLNFQEAYFFVQLKGGEEDLLESWDILEWEAN